jgi:hypothetical protein
MCRLPYQIADAKQTGTISLGDRVEAIVPSQLIPVVTSLIEDKIETEVRDKVIQAELLSEVSLRRSLSSCSCLVRSRVDEVKHVTRPANGLKKAKSQLVNPQKDFTYQATQVEPPP